MFRNRVFVYVLLLMFIASQIEAANCTQFLTSGTSCSVPAGQQVITAEGIGAGINGLTSGTHNLGRFGGGGGAYAKATGLTITGTVNFQIGVSSGSQGTSASPGAADTWFNSSTSTLYAQGGGGVNPNNSGKAANCVPTTGANDGGTGGPDANGSFGGGGGGGGGASGAGNNASSSTCAAGDGDDSNANRGIGATTCGGTGGNGTEYQASPAFGSGGGGAGGNSTTVAGGPAGTYGAGGGGGYNKGAGGAGAGGLIVLTFASATATATPAPCPDILHVAQVGCANIN